MSDTSDKSDPTGKLIIINIIYRRLAERQCTKTSMTIKICCHELINLASEKAEKFSIVQMGNHLILKCLEKFPDETMPESTCLLSFSISALYKKNPIF